MEHGDTASDSRPRMLNEVGLQRDLCLLSDQIQNLQSIADQIHTEYVRLREHQLTTECQVQEIITRMMRSVYRSDVKTQRDEDNLDSDKDEKDNNANIWKCPQKDCHKEYKRAQDVERHFGIHIPYKSDCKPCNREFTRADQMVAHRCATFVHGQSGRIASLRNTIKSAYADRLREISGGFLKTCYAVQTNNTPALLHAAPGDGPQTHDSNAHGATHQLQQHHMVQAKTSDAGIIIPTSAEALQPSSNNTELEIEPVRNAQEVPSLNDTMKARLLSQSHESTSRKRELAEHSSTASCEEGSKRQRTLPSGDSQEFDDLVPEGFAETQYPATLNCSWGPVYPLDSLDQVPKWDAAFPLLRADELSTLYQGTTWP